MAINRDNVIREFRPFDRRPGLMRVDAEDLDHVHALYRLREETEQTVPSFAEHAAYVQGRPHLAWYLILAGAGMTVGAIYLTRNREIGVSVARAHRRQGHGGAAVRELMTKHDDGRVFLASILPDDDESARFWESLGFTLSRHTYAKEK